MLVEAPVPNLNTTHALTAVLNTAKQSVRIWVMSNDICYLLLPLCGGRLRWL